MILRDYQQRVLDALYSWWLAHPGADQVPLLVLPTGAGKSVVIAELERLLWEHWPEDRPRTVIIVPSKELAEQNAAKLHAMLPTHLTIGYYSAAIGQKVPTADVIVATIGSIYKAAALLGNIKMVVVDEAHLINPAGAESGRYRQFLADLQRFCAFRVVGLTATPFRGNGVWLTDGDDPLFTGIAATVTMRELLDAGHLAPLARPVDALQTQIDTRDIAATGGDYNVAQLAERVEDYLESAADETCRLAASRVRWIAFLPTVANAEHFCGLLRERGIAAALVSGETPKAERETLIADFRGGRLRCLVTVLALAIGFDVPAVDCVIWLRPTKSPVLYVQGAGRGMRTAPGKTDCLWLDFSDTTERLGPVDQIRGRRKIRRPDAGAPCVICDECGARVTPASALECPECGAILREVTTGPVHAAQASDAPVLSQHLEAVPTRLVRYEVSEVRYGIHRKEGKPDSLRVDYYAGMRRAASEWVCFEHGGFAQAKAAGWWLRRSARPVPATTGGAVLLINEAPGLVEPVAITLNEAARFPEIVGFEFPEQEQAA